jgi:hypothetical protein
MTTRNMTMPDSQPGTPTREHGCTPCKETCCSLDCLVQPRFYCGQLLTDQDLNALRHWTQDKLRLNRYRDGWGVVCGLAVRCDPKTLGGVVIGPGYAVSCCGDDIIVCQDAPKDLSEACRDEKDPCADLTKLTKKDEGKDLEREIVLGGGTYKASEVRTVDLVIRYDEQYAEPQTPLGRSACGQTTACEYSRTREVFKLDWQPAVIDSDPVEDAAKAWLAQYEKRLAEAMSFASHFKFPGTSAVEVQRAIMDSIDANPLHEFCFVRDRVCAMNAEELTSEAELVKVLFWLAQDYRNHFLTCECHNCTGDPGVPLARIYLHALRHSGKRVCKVVAIDSYPPYRRLLSKDCWPAPLGQINLGQFIWHRWEEVRAALDERGVLVQREDIELTKKGLEKAFTCDLLVPCDHELVAQVYQAGAPLGDRVVGFYRAPRSIVESARSTPEVSEQPPAA